MLNGTAIVSVLAFGSSWPWAFSKCARRLFTFAGGCITVRQ